MRRQGMDSPLSVRLSEQDIAWLDEQAARLGITRSDVVRLNLRLWAEQDQRERERRPVSAGST